jgi:hypothetical protein
MPPPEHRKAFLEDTQTISFQRRSSKPNGPRSRPQRIRDLRNPWSRAECSLSLCDSGYRYLAIPCTIVILRFTQRVVVRSVHQAASPSPLSS